MRARNLKGAMLIELLVALLVAGMLMVALTASISELMRLSTKSQNDSIGAQIAANIMERVRATPFDLLNQGISSPIVVHSGGNAPSIAVYDPNNALFTRPVMVDATTKNWSSTSTQLPESQTPATARVDITGSGDSRLITVTVKWSTYDENAPNVKQYVLQSFVYRYGIQRDAPW